MMSILEKREKPLLRPQATLQAILDAAGAG